MTVTNSLSKVRGSLFAGALGDALGAPVEFKKLPEILEITSGQGVSDLTPYDPTSFSPDIGPGERSGIGIITDDTAMLAATAAALISAFDTYGCLDDRALDLVHQAYLRWGEHQPWTKGDYQSRIDPGITLPSWFPDFCHRTGAGMMTMSSLNSGKIGTWDTPILTPSVRTEGKFIRNNGCGGMMRVAPVGWMAAADLIADPFLYGAKTAAITHGHNMAQTASGGMALLIAGLVQGHSWTAAAESMLQRMKAEPRAEGSYDIAVRAIETGDKRGNDLNFHDIDHVPVVLGVAQPDNTRNLFSSPTIWAQALLISRAAQSWSGSEDNKLRRALCLAVTHSGDSDSLGSIVGNILGAQWGEGAVPEEWKNKLQLLSSLEKMANNISHIFANAGLSNKPKEISRSSFNPS